jgi:hypothetical protein
MVGFQNVSCFFPPEFTTSSNFTPGSWRADFSKKVNIGVHTLGKTDIPTNTVNWFDIVKSCDHPVPFDVANLMFNVQWCYALQYREGDLTNALAKLKQVVFAFFMSSGLKLLYVLSGKRNYRNGVRRNFAASAPSPRRVLRALIISTCCSTTWREAALSFSRSFLSFSS